MQYLLRLRTQSVSMQWEFPFKMASDAMAREYTMKIAKQDPICGACMGVELFNISEDRHVMTLETQRETRVKEIS